MKEYESLVVRVTTFTSSPVSRCRSFNWELRSENWEPIYSHFGPPQRFFSFPPPTLLTLQVTIVLDTVHRAAPLAGAATVCARDGALPFSPAVGERVGLFVGLLDLSHPDSSLRYRLRPTPTQDPVLGLSPSRLSLLPFARVVFRS